MEYLDFDLEIAREGKKYSARVLRSPGGDGSSLFKLPFSDLELENFVLKMGRTGIRTRGIDSPEATAAKEFGGRLFDAVFTPELQNCLGTSLAIAAERRSGLRIRLRLKAAELIDLPWEFLYRRDLRQFLALGVATPLVRYLDTPNPIPALAVTLPLRVLVVVASPAGFPALDTDRELRNLETALGDLIRQGFLLLEKRPHISLSQLQSALRTSDWHVLHFVGHGLFDSATADGALLFEDEAGNPDRVSAEYLGAIFHNQPSLRLAVLNACDGARTSRSDPFAGTAQNLLLHGLPAVIGMQFPISDSAAISFARGFYAAIAGGFPVDTALVEARMAVYTDHRSMEWGTPVLYMRSEDGQLFDLRERGEDLPPAVEALAGARHASTAPEARESQASAIEPRANRQRLTYYLYVSDAKVDMLFPQVPVEFKRAIAADSGLSLQQLSVSPKAGGGPESRIARLEAVVSFIRDNEELGSIDQPAVYIADTCKVRSATYGRIKGGNPLFIYFGGTVGLTLVGLWGSWRHVVGQNLAQARGAFEPGSSLADHALWYLLTGVSPESALPEWVSPQERIYLNDLRRKAEDWKGRQLNTFGLFEDDVEPGRTAWNVLLSATGALQGPEQQVEFLAKSLVSRSLDQGAKVMLATPLYVALAE